ncbi:MAG: phosphopantetheine-binding protein [Exilibacterium sp.]
MKRDQIIDCILAVAREIAPIMDDFVPDRCFTDKSSAQPGRVGLDTCFVDLGINSIDFIAIVVEVMEKLHLDLPVEKFCNIFRLREMVELFYEESSTSVYEESSTSVYEESSTGLYGECTSSICLHSPERGCS